MDVFSFSLAVILVFILIFGWAWALICEMPNYKASGIAVQIVSGVVAVGVIVWANVAFNCSATQEIKAYPIVSYDPSASIFAYTDEDEESLIKLDAQHISYDNKYSEPTIVEKTRKYLFLEDFRREIHIPTKYPLVIEDLANTYR